VGGAYYDPASGIWLRGYSPTSGGTVVAKIQWCHGDDGWQDICAVSGSVGLGMLDNTILAIAPWSTAGYWNVLGTDGTYVHVSLLNNGTCAYNAFAAQGTLASAGLLGTTALFAIGGTAAGGWLLSNGVTTLGTTGSAGTATKVMLAVSPTMAIAAANYDNHYLTTTNGTTSTLYAFPSGMNIGTGTGQSQISGLVWSSSILGSYWVLTLSSSVLGFSTYTSLDGANWVQRGTVSSGANAPVIADLASVGHHLVAVCGPYTPASGPQYPDGSYSRVITSEDSGATWHKAPCSILGSAPLVYAGGGQALVNVGRFSCFSQPSHIV